jgi:hypothetical protein
MKMKENITDRPAIEETLQEELIKHAVPSPSEEVTSDAVVDESPLPKGMREKVETIEISTLTPNK